MDSFFVNLFGLTLKKPIWKIKESSGIELLSLDTMQIFVESMVIFIESIFNIYFWFISFIFGLVQRQNRKRQVDTCLCGINGAYSEPIERDKYPLQCQSVSSGYKLTSLNRQCILQYYLYFSEIT